MQVLQLAHPAIMIRQFKSEVQQHLLIWNRIPHKVFDNQEIFLVCGLSNQQPFETLLA
jgi:hypothetical protein